MESRVGSERDSDRESEKSMEDSSERQWRTLGNSREWEWQK